MSRGSPARTSSTHPLQIAAVRAGPGTGRIGITFCPGKCQPAAVTGAWSRDLGLDLDAIRDWGAVAVVSLIEQHEIDMLGVAAIGAEVAARHMDWVHLPIRDVSTPDAAFEVAWVEAGERLRDRLRAGFDIVVHCKGGLGRAGTIAARLLVELGVAPKAAIDSVRAMRPGAIETGAQAAFVQACRVAPEAVPATDDASIRDRAVGALVGLAVGDAVGTTLEFVARDQRPMLIDMVGGGPFALGAGEWTDDTAMAIALGDSLAHDPDLDPADLMRRFVSWWQDGTYSCTGRCFDIGVTTRQALARFERTGDPFAGSTDPRSAGNGSLMRLAPVAIAHWADPVRRAQVAAAQSRTTHAALQAVEACVAYADILAAAIAGRPRSVVLSQGAVDDAAVSAVLRGSWRGKRRAAIQSTGYVVHSLEAALWSVARTGDFRSAVLLAANLGDDADTTAAIAGQLAGALYGYSGIPQVWRDRLAWQPRIATLAQALLP